ncbi:AAA family ATPase [Streptomyces sp. NPDC088925]|uniref:AAA family ATPase n=1 Tax=Streptomyces sp. NPDC088925 TaxID=3365914 RepID=UPI003823EB3C
MTRTKAPAKKSGPTLKTRKPTGIVPWPLILIEGEEGSGKSYAAAEFSGSEKVGATFWLDLVEGSGDEYAAVPGADYNLIEHDGTYRDILEQIEAVHALASDAAKSRKPPTLLIIDTASALWRMLTNWTHERARRTRKNARLLEEDPDAAVDIAMNLWNDAVERWMRIMHLLQTFPGIVVLLARGKQVSVVDDNGTPISGRHDWRVSGHKDLGFDSTVWVRLKRDEEPQIIKARSLRLRVERKKPLRVPEFTIEGLVFDMLGCTAASQPRRMPALSGDAVQPWLSRVQTIGTREGLGDLWRETRPEKSGLTREEAATVQAAINVRLAQIESTPPELGQDPASRLRAAAAEHDRPQDTAEQP